MSEPTGSVSVTVSESALATTVDGETVILETESGTYFGLNEVGSMIWEELDEPRTVEELQDRVLAEYDVDAETCERDCKSVLATMESKNLIVREQ